MCKDKSYYHRCSFLHCNHCGECPANIEEDKFYGKSWAIVFELPRMRLKNYIINKILDRKVKNMAKLKKCSRCGNSYGKDRHFYYGCGHHPIETEIYELPKDFTKMINVNITNETK